MARQILKSMQPHNAHRALGGAREVAGTHGRQPDEDAPKPGLLDRWSSLGWGIFGFEFIGAIAGSVVAGVGGVIGYVNSSVGGAIEFLGKGLTAPIKALRETKLSEIHRFPEKLMSAFRESVGETKHLFEYGPVDNALKRGEKAARSGAEAVEAAAGQAAELNPFKGAGPQVDKAVGAVGRALQPLGRRVAEFWDARAKSHLKAISEEGEKLRGILQEGTHSRINGLRARFGSDVAKEGSQHEVIEQLTHALEDALKTLEKPGLTEEEATAAVKRIKDIAEHSAIADAVKADKALGRQIKAVTGAVEQLQGRLESLFGSKVMSEMFMDTEKGLRGLPKTIGNLSAYDVAFKGGILAGTAVQTNRTAGHAKQSVGVLKQLYEDMTGEKASTSKVLFGHVPPIVRQARSDMMQKFGPELIAAAANITVDLSLIKSHHSKWDLPLLMGGQAVHMIAGQFAQNQFLDAYKELSDAARKGKDANPQGYAALIAAASKDAAQAGGTDNRLVGAMAKEYASKHTPPQDVLKEIADKDRFNAHAAQVQADLKAQAEAAQKAHDAEATMKPEDAMAAVQHTLDGEGKDAQAHAKVQADAQPQANKADDATPTMLAAGPSTTIDAGSAVSQTQAAQVAQPEQATQQAADASQNPTVHVGAMQHEGRVSEPQRELHN